MKLLLFDIDGTLLHCKGAGKEAIFRSYQKVTGNSPDRKRINFAGATDRQIIEDLLDSDGALPCDVKFSEMIACYEELLPLFLRKIDPTPLPGVVDLLQELTSRPNVTIGLLTGNVRGGAFQKLRHFRLNHYFEFGGFGDVHRPVP